MNRAFKERRYPDGAGCNDVNSKYVPKQNEEEKLQRRTEGRKEGRWLKGERTIARAVDGGKVAGQNGRKSRYYRSHGGENTITPLPGSIMNLSLAT